MSDELITRLVVGEPMRVQLGRPVGQRLEKQGGSQVLRWNAGAWISGAKPKAGSAPTATTFAVPLQKLSRLTEAASAAPRRIRWPMVGAVCAGLLVAASAAVLFPRQAQEPALPIAPIAPIAASGVVKVVSEPYTGEPRSPIPAEGLPIAAPSDAVAPAAAAAAQPPIPAAAPQAAQPTVVAAAAAGARVPAPAKAASEASKDGQPRPPAVLLDVSSPVVPRAAASKPAPAAAPAPAQLSTAQPAPQAVAAQVAAARPVSPPPARGPSGHGLVTITPDGKIAVFTNPKTRLPEQFKVGDTLPNGETVRSIDAKEGRVATSSKEYSLE